MQLDQYANDELAAAYNGHDLKTRSYEAGKICLPEAILTLVNNQVQNASEKRQHEYNPWNQNFVQNKLQRIHKPRSN